MHIDCPWIYSSFNNQSTGASIPTDFVYNRTSVEESYCKFPDFARKAFWPACATFGKFPWLAAIISFLRDGYYNSGMLDWTLQELYSRTRWLFDVAAISPAGNRIAVVISWISDGKPCVFTNYHGVGCRVATLPYEVLVPLNDASDPLLWEV